jgi:hypothetical protein
LPGLSSPVLDGSDRTFCNAKVVIFEFMGWWRLNSTKMHKTLRVTPTTEKRIKTSKKLLGGRLLLKSFL